MGDARVIKHRGSIRVPVIERKPVVKEYKMPELAAPVPRKRESVCILPVHHYVNYSDAERIKCSFWCAPCAGSVHGLRLVAKRIPPVPWIVDLYLNDNLVGQTVMEEGAAFFALANAPHADEFHVEQHDILYFAAHADRAAWEAHLSAMSPMNRKPDDDVVMGPRDLAATFQFEPEGE